MNNNKQIKILLTDAETVQALSTLKALKDTNAYITIICKSMISYGYSSKYPNKRILIKGVNTDEEYELFLMSYIKKNHQDIIIPLFHISALIFSKNKSVIEGLGTKVAVPEYDKYIIAYDKSILMSFCEKNNIPHPKTINIRNNSLENLKSIKYPALIKPNISSGANGILIVNDEEDCVNKQKKIINSFSGYTVQEYIENDGIYYSAMLYRSSSGKYSETVIIEIKRYFPLKGGTSSYCKSIYNLQLTNLCKEILNKMTWVGFANFDFMYNKEACQFYLIDFNPRFPASLDAAYIAGINFPEIIINDLLYDNKISYIYRPGKELRFFAMDVMWFLFSKDRFICTPSWFKFIQKNLFYQDASLSDPLPVIFGALMGVIKYFDIKYIKSKFQK